jgi:hypothetical protein
MSYQPQQSQAALHLKPNTASRCLPDHQTDAQIRYEINIQASLLLNKIVP